MYTILETGMTPIEQLIECDRPLPSRDRSGRCEKLTRLHRGTCPTIELLQTTEAARSNLGESDHKPDTPILIPATISHPIVHQVHAHLRSLSLSSLLPNAKEAQDRLPKASQERILLPLMPVFPLAFVVLQIFKRPSKIQHRAPLDLRQEFIDDLSRVRSFVSTGTELGGPKPACQDMVPLFCFSFWQISPLGCDDRELGWS